MDGQQTDDPKEQVAASVVTVEVSGALTIERSGEFRQTLTDALAGAQHVILDAGHLHEIDIPALQLICSACKTAAAANKTFTFAESPPECLMTLEKGIGICQDNPCNETGNTSCILSGGMKSWQN